MYKIIYIRKCFPTMKYDKLVAASDMKSVNVIVSDIEHSNPY